MLNRLFGNYLVEKQLLKQEQLDDLLPVPKDLKAEVETIAVINKVISSATAQELLKQIDKSAERFGETAIDAGYLTDEKLDEILTYQSNAFMKFVQELLNANVLGMEQVNPLLDEFQQNGEFSDAQLSSLIHDDLEQCVNIFVPLKANRLKEFVLTMIRTIRRLIDCDAYLDKAYTAHSLQLDKYACQTIAGDLHIRVYISAPGNGLLAIANYFTGDTYEAVNEDALDNVGEFINCINGLFATNLSYDDVSVDMNAPEYALDGPFISNEKLYVIPIHANGSSFRAVLEVYE
ncbi:MAG: chemotaxis protein CheX [Lachnospiraceae bacterium]|mgnify:CR=1 FL=1|nr:chemotaxis protein CheX [Lachnospiraceae bacterium]